MVRQGLRALKRSGVAVKGAGELFTKNTGLCQGVKAAVYRPTLAQCWKVKGWG